MKIISSPISLSHNTTTNYIPKQSVPCRLEAPFNLNRKTTHGRRRKKVRIHYTGTLTDGSQFDSSIDRDPLEFETGSGMAIPGFDSAVRDMEVGDKKTVTIPCKEAYGGIREEMIGDIPKDRFPKSMEIQIGMPLHMQGPQGPMPIVVKDITENAVTIDADPFFAADAIAAALMGLAPDVIPHLRIGAAHGLGEINLDHIDITPSTWRDAVTPFARVPQNLSIQFPDTDILDNQSCSACQSTLLLFLKHFGKDMFQYLPCDRPVNIAIGKGHDDLPENTILIGNCTRAHKDSGLFVNGCPPVASAIIGKIKDACPDYRKADQ